ncbi:MAG: DUF4357 domain-containing protein [Elusimicrobiota bacterium]
MKGIIYAIKINDLSHSGLRVLDVKIGRTTNINSTLAQYRRVSRNIKILDMWLPNIALSLNDCERGAHDLAAKYAYERDSEKFVFLQESYNKFADNVSLLLKRTSKSDLLDSKSKEELLFCKGRGVEGRGKYIKNGFIIIEGSQAAKEVVKSMKGKGATKKRLELVKNKIMVEDDDCYVFKKDYKANSPSRAACIIFLNPATPKEFFFLLTGLNLKTRPTRIWDD